MIAPMWFSKAFEGLNITSTGDTCFGAPRIPGRRITVCCVAGRFAAGEKVSAMAKEYGVSRGQIEDCIRFALRTSKGRRLDLDRFEQEHYGAPKDGG